MNAKGHEFVRVGDRKSEPSFSIEIEDSMNNGHHKTKARPSVSYVLRCIGRKLGNGSVNMKNLWKASAAFPVSDHKQRKLPPREKIIDPQGQTLHKWNKFVGVMCLAAVSCDKFFFYIPVINDLKKCIDFDGKLLITICALRTFFDLFNILRIMKQFNKGFLAPYSRASETVELIQDPVPMTKRYSIPHFFLDFLSIIPLPQVIVLAIIPKLKTSNPSLAMDLLKYTVEIQYVPRVWRIYGLYKELTTTYRKLTEKAWGRAVSNLLFFIIASEVVGAMWYILSIESVGRCWRRELENASLFKEEYLSCGHRHQNVFPLLNKTCSFVDPDKIAYTNNFNFGIFFDALDSGIVKSTTQLPHKFFYCLWWGLRNLSSIGQNLKTSTDVAEIAFALFIALFGLVLYALLIGNMQKYLQIQSTNFTEEKLRVKRQETEHWMCHRMLPEFLKERIRRYEEYKWQENRGVDEEALIRNLPRDIRTEVNRHLCFTLVKKVPMFEKMDEQLLDAICNRLKPRLYIEKSYMVGEGDPVEEMLFIMRGKVSSVTTNGGRPGFFNSSLLMAGDFCGEELLTWALDPNSSSNLPISTRTVQTISQVEAFSLMAHDLKFVASQFPPLHSKQLQHTFRLYSSQWKTWGACFIQAAWRRYWKRKFERSLREAEDKLEDALANQDGYGVTIGATIYASRFAANAQRNLRQNSRHDGLLLPLLPPKPAEPDFNAQNH